MTRDKWEPFIMTNMLAERMAAHEMAACAEFVEQNRKFLTGFARKMLRNFTNVIPAGQYEEGDCIDQIFVDFVYFDYSNAEMLMRSIWRSYIGIAYGGFKRVVFGRSDYRALSLDATIGISSRSGDKADGDELGNLLKSNEPTPYEMVEEREHVEEITPHFYHEIKRFFGGGHEDQGGATVGEILAAKEGNAFRDMIEDIFQGYLFEQVRAMARRVV